MRDMHETAICVDVRVWGMFHFSSCFFVFKFCRNRQNGNTILHIVTKIVMMLSTSVISELQLSCDRYLQFCLARGKPRVT